MKLAKALTSIQDIQEQLTHIVTELNSIILTLPDNPNIQRKNDNCFIMNSKYLLNNWGVFYHDYKSQYKAIIQIISSGEPQSVVNKLKSIIKDHKHEKLKFHPDVIKNLKIVLLRR